MLVTPVLQNTAHTRATKRLQTHRCKGTTFLWYTQISTRIYTELLLTNTDTILTNTDEHGRGTDCSFLYESHESDECFLCTEQMEYTELFLHGNLF